MARVLLDPDPGAARARLDAGDGIARADEDGLRVAALLIVKLRFERVMQGSHLARRAFEANPAQFAEMFRAYHTQAAPQSPLATAEGAAFERWLEGC
jgi:hypothetical protein